jgi:hypothetical protein
MWLDLLIVVDDEILSSFFLLDDEGSNAVIGGRHVHHGFIWQSIPLNYVFCNPKESLLF